MVLNHHPHSTPFLWPSAPALAAAAVALTAWATVLQGVDFVTQLKTVTSKWSESSGGDGGAATYPATQHPCAQAMHITSKADGMGRAHAGRGVNMPILGQKS